MMRIQTLVMSSVLLAAAAEPKFRFYRLFWWITHEQTLRCAWERVLNRKSQRRYRLKFADTYYGELNHYGMYWLKWADVRRCRY